MKLWLLLPVEGLIDDNPWEPWYDKSFGFVIRAETEQIARNIAHLHAGDENREEFLGQQTVNTKSPWLDCKYSTCEPLLSDGKEGMIMEDYHSA